MATMRQVLRVDEDGRGFVDGEGKPLFFLGDTQWHLFRSFPLEAAREILDDRRQKGFTVLLSMLIGWEPDPQPNVNGDLPWTVDPGEPNEDYYRHVDRIVELAGDYGFVHILGVYHKTHHRFYTLESARKSARWIANRYRDMPNLVWSMYPEARETYRPIARAIADGLREGDGGRHMVTVHPDPSPTSSSFLHDEPWLSFNMLQTCIDIELIPAMVAADYGLRPSRPAVMAEGGYEGLEFGRLSTPLDIRRMAFWTYLSGGHFVYGHNDHYQAFDQWRVWLDAPGARCCTIFREIVESFPAWWSVIPDQSIVNQGVGEGIAHLTAARSAKGDWAAVYFPSLVQASIRMDRIQTSDQVAAAWINPVDGSQHPFANYSYRDVIDLAPPDEWVDAVLLLRGV